MRGSTAGLADGAIVSPDSIHAAFLVFLDIMFSSLIAAPVVVAYWRGTWNLMMWILHPDDLLWSAIDSCILGTVGHFIFFVFQDKFSRSFHPDKHRITFMLMSRIYTAIYGIICVNGWRGGWFLMDIYVPQSISILFAITVISSILLVFCKGLRNISSTPFAISTDHSKDYFVVPTMFKTSATTEPGFFFIDCAFSVLVIGTLVVFVWRSLWVLCDLLIYPSDLTLSALSSLAIGHGIVAITFALQSLMKWACDRLTGFWRVAVADVFLFFSFVGTVNVWRGAWMLLDLHFLPDDKLTSNLLCHGVSFVLLAMLNCSNSVLVRGVYIDAEEPDGQCVIFPVYYIRLFFQRERVKKQRRVLDALEKGEQHAGLLSEKNDKNSAQITKSEKSVEMISMASNRTTVDHGPTIVANVNGDHKMSQ